MSLVTDSDLTLSLWWRTQPAADFGEKLALGRRQALHAGCDDLVEYPIDLGIRTRVRLAARLGALSGGRNPATAADARGLRHQDTRLRRWLPLPLHPGGPPLLPRPV